MGFDNYLLVAHVDPMMRTWVVHGDDDVDGYLRFIQTTFAPAWPP